MSEHMPPEDFRRHGHRVVDWIADNRTTLEQHPVRSRIEPGRICRILLVNSAEALVAGRGVAVGCELVLRGSRLVWGGLMSMRPVPWPEVPEQTALVARRAFPKGSLAIRLRDELGPIFQDADFIGAFGARGKPGIVPSLLMLVTVLQFVERLTDRQAAAAVAGAAYGWGRLVEPLDDYGFEPHLVHPLRCKAIALARLKNDKVDAAIPARILRTDLLP